MNRLAAALGLLMVVGSPAFGADAFVVATSSDVSVNSGVGWVAVTPLREVKAGDQVMANETGHGWIIYCGCDEEIRPGKVYTIENRECKVENVLSLNDPNLPHTVLRGDQREVEKLHRCRRAAPVLYLLGGAGVAVGTCAAVGCFQGGHEKTKQASP
jgi:hypothetical protein